MARTLIFIAIAACTSLAQAQSPSAPEAVIAPSSVPSEEGKRIIRTETDHRLEIGRLGRELERESMKLKIKTTELAIQKAEEEAASSTAAMESINSPKVAAVPAPVGFAPAAVGVAGAIPEPAASQEAPPAPPAPPKPIAKVGGTVIFATDSGQMNATLGQSVSGYLLTQIEGRRVTLESIALPKATLVMQIP